MLVPGVTVTLSGGYSVTVAVAHLAASATLVARTVNVCCVATLAGAVYSPILDIVPTLGLADHITSVFAAFDTVTENCCA